MIARGLRIAGARWQPMRFCWRCGASESMTSGRSMRTSSYPSVTSQPLSLSGTRLYSSASLDSRHILHTEEEEDPLGSFDVEKHWGDPNARAHGSFDGESDDVPNEEADSRLIPNRTMHDKRPHIPVLCKEVLDCFCRLDNLADNGPFFLDMTFGAGGHTAALLDTFPECRVVALDRDPSVLEYAMQLQEKYPERLLPIIGKFSEIPELFKQHMVNKPFDGILLDAGCSSMQMDQSSRGFAFSHPESPLDMRMEGQTSSSSITAADIVNRMNEENLLSLFKKYGEEKQAAKIARAIVESRFMMKRIETTGDLADVVYDVALRIFINDELNELDYAMAIAHKLLRPRGIFVGITFHSMECKIVKENLHSADWRNRLLHDRNNPVGARVYQNQAKWLPKEDVLDAMQFRWTAINKHVITPTDEEIDYNPRSRSAKLRAAMKNSV
ncbi:hypothetical protein RvY_12751-2 [Ramazzottius varieornatus]|uniref:Methyltransferase-like protein 15 n=1 Tax=Ramazzottius varieornatus TaxID=947166 RepID=A0A1D1VKL0_RAMVA|nr:hypothetical protein RvY_12751-2 [Ramazzottius varieornatus]